MAPLISTSAGITLKAYGFTKGSADYRAYYLSTSTASNFAWSWNSDTSGNYYIGGGISGVRTNLIKIDRIAGSITWQKTDSITNIASALGPAVNNTTGQIAWCSVPNGQTGSILSVSNASAISWQTKLNGGQIGQPISAYPNGVDSSGNVYAYSASGSSTAFLGKFTNTGTVSWQRTISRASTTNNTTGFVHLDGSNNAYYCVFHSDTAVVGFMTGLYKYNSSGTIQWQVGINTTLNTGFFPTALDGTSAGVTAMVLSPRTSGPLMVVTSVNASGTGVFNRQLTGTTNPTSLGVAVSPDGNIYALGSVGQALYVIKYNASGTLQWQRKITSSSANFGTGAATIRAADNLNFLVGTRETNNTGNALALRLPTDGTLTGTYVIGGQTITYANTTDLTDSSISIVWTSQGFTDAAGSQAFTTSSVSFTDTTYTLTKA
jgi:hypothetical protein